MRELFSKIFGRSDLRNDKAQRLVQVAHLQAVAMFLPLSEQFPVLGQVDLEQWDFIVTIAGVFLATSRLEKKRLTESQKQPIFTAIESGLQQYKSDAVRAFAV